MWLVGICGERVRTHGSQSAHLLHRVAGCQHVIKEFWNSKGINPSTDFIPDPGDVWRCWHCGHGYKTESALKAHITRTHSKRRWRGTTTDKDTRREMRKDAQETLEHVVMCEGKEIQNVWMFKYLDSWFQADGSQAADIAARIVSASTTAGKMRLRHIMVIHHNSAPIKAPHL